MNFCYGNQKQLVDCCAYWVCFNSYRPTILLCSYKHSKCFLPNLAQIN